MTAVRLPSGDGMAAEAAENRSNAFISLEHLGFGAQKEAWRDALCEACGAA